MDHLQDVKIAIEAKKKKILSDLKLSLQNKPACECF